MPEPEQTESLVGSTDGSVSSLGPSTTDLRDSDGRSPDPTPAILDASETHTSFRADRPSVAAGSVPGYVILEMLGEGGMGAVYKAMQVGLNRLVAIKMVHAARKDRARFVAEAEAVGSIGHANVVRVFEVGEAEAGPFLAMEYLPGGSLGQLLKREDRLDYRPGAILVAKLARGVDAAHQEGIVHRDLKPENILFDALGEPKVTDFGLAKRGSGGDLTRTHAVMGTPSYMAPEQARGGTKFVGPQADVYALGVILHEVATGVRPFVADDPISLLRKVAEEEPMAPSKRLKGFPRDLERVILACLSKDPADRYPTAGALADDLDRFVGGLPVAIGRAGPIERALKWARRKPTLATVYLLTAAVVVLTVFGVSIFFLWTRAETARAVAEVAREGEARARDKLARVEYGRTIQVAYEEWRNGNVATSTTLLESTRPDLRGWEYRYLHRLNHSELFINRGHKAQVKVVAWSPDGRTTLTGSADKTAGSWDAVTGEPRVAFLGHNSHVVAASFSKDGSRLVTGAYDWTGRVWDPATGGTIAILKGHKYPVSAASITPDNSTVLTGSWDGTARLWDAKTGAPGKILEAKQGKLAAASLRPDGLRFVTGGDDGTLKVWQLDGFALVREIKGEQSSISSATFSPDGSEILASFGSGVSKTFDAETGGTLLTLGGHRGFVASAVWSPDGTRIATAGSDMISQVWDAKTGDLLSTQKGHVLSINSVAWSPDGTRLLTASDDQTARTWDPEVGVELNRLVGHTGQIRSSRWSPDGSKILTGASDKTARIWDSTHRVTLAVLEGHSAMLSRVAWSRDGSKVVTTSFDKTAKIWEADTGTLLQTLKGHRDAVDAAEFSPDGTKVATAGGLDKTLRIWDVASGAEKLLVPGVGGRITGLAWSPDGRRLVVGESRDAVTIRDSSTGAVVRELRVKDSLMASVAYSADGSKIMTGLRDGSTRIWDANTGAELMLLKGHSSFVWTPAWSPDGTRIVTGSSDKTVKLWDASTGAELLTLRSDYALVYSASWSPDGSRIVDSGDVSARIWDDRPVGVARPEPVGR